MVLLPPHKGGAIKYRALHNLIAYNRFCGQKRSKWSSL
jgi:hypothetical protein